MVSGRRALHAYVSGDAHELWHGAAAEWGVSVSAILEALAPQLESGDTTTSGTGDEQLITTARKIDAERRRRTR